jgi:hypothetical protein
MRRSGTAIMGIGIAEGEDRATRVVEEALNSPLLDNIDIRGSKNLLLYITYGDNEVSMDEMGEITELVHERTGNNADLILGHGYDENLGENIAVTIIATGFDMPKQLSPPTPPDIPEQEQPGQIEPIGQIGQIGRRIVHPLNEEVTENNSSIPSYENLVPEPEPVAVENEATDNTEDSASDSDSGMQIVVKEDDKSETKLPEKEEVEEIPSFQKPVTVQQLIPEPNISTPAATPSQTAIKTIVAEEDDFEFHLSDAPKYSTNYQTDTIPVVAVRPPQGISVYPKTESDPNDNLTKLRNDKLRNFSMHSRGFEMSETIIEEPAYRRRNVQFEPANHSSESHVSNYHLFPGEDGKPIFKQNDFLHGSVD